MHCDGVDIGPIEWQPAIDAQTQGISGLWVRRASLPTLALNAATPPILPRPQPDLL
jgi:hypothetical protein